MSPTNRTIRPTFFCTLLGLSVITFSVVSSCTSSGPVHVSVLGNENMNSGYPIRVFLYKLKNDTNFMRVSPESFWGEGEKEFAGDLVEPGIEIMLAPGDTVWKTLQVSKDTNYIGAAADFRKPDNKGWRLVCDLTVKRPKEILLTVSSNRIEIEKTK